MAIEDPNQTGIQTIKPDSLDTGAALGQANAQSIFQTPLNTDSLDTGAALGQANASEMVSNFSQSFRFKLPCDNSHSDYPTLINPYF